MGRAIAALCVVLLLSACSGDDAAPSSATPSPGATVIATESPAPNSTATQAPLPAATATSEPVARSTPAPQASGVRGTALVGPSCPVEREDDPCPDRPWQGVVVAKTLSGAEAARTESDVDGRFEMQLPPGEYELVANPDGFLPAPSSLYITVLPDQVLEVVLMLDSGIR